MHAYSNNKCKCMVVTYTDDWERRVKLSPGNMISLGEWLDSRPAEHLSRKQQQHCPIATPQGLGDFVQLLSILDDSVPLMPPLQTRHLQSFVISALMLLRRVTCRMGWITAWERRETCPSTINHGTITWVTRIMEINVGSQVKMLAQKIAPNVCNRRTWFFLYLVLRIRPKETRRLGPQFISFSRR